MTIVAGARLTEQLAVGVGLTSAVVLALALASGRLSRSEVPTRARLVDEPSGPRLMFLSMASDATFRRVAVAPLDAPQQSAYVTRLSCERVYFAGHRGLCLTVQADGRNQKYFAQVFDERFAP